MSSMLDKIRSMRQEAKAKETKLITTSKSWGAFMGIQDLEDGKTTLRIVRHPDDPIPFYPFRSTWLEVEESIDNLSRYHLNNIVKENKLERALGIRKADELNEIEDDKLRSMLIDELGHDFKKNVNKRIFISKIHGNPEIPDVIEEYIKFASQVAKSMSQDHEETKRKMNPIRGFRDKTGKWNPGIMPSTSYVCYVYEWDETDRVLKRFEMWEKHMNEIEKLYASFDDPDEPLTIDPFSDPKEGVPIVVDKFKNDKNKYDYSFTDKKNTSRTGTYKDFVKQFELTREQIAELEDKQPLNEIYTGTYSRRDFELALSGLQLFDEKNRMGVFSHDEFLDVVEEIARYYEQEGDQEKKEERRKPEAKKEVSETPTPRPAPKPAPVKDPEPEEEDFTSPYGNSIEELKEYIRENNLGIRVRRTHTFQDVVDSIEEAEEELAKEESKVADPIEEEPNYAPEDPDDDMDGSFTQEKAEEKPSVDIDSLRARLRGGLRK